MQYPGSKNVYMSLAYFFTWRWWIQARKCYGNLVEISYPHSYPTFPTGKDNLYSFFRNFINGFKLPNVTKMLTRFYTTVGTGLRLWMCSILLQVSHFSTRIFRQRHEMSQASCFPHIVGKKWAIKRNSFLCYEHLATSLAWKKYPNDDVFETFSRHCRRLIAAASISAFIISFRRLVINIFGGKKEGGGDADQGWLTLLFKVFDLTIFFW